MDNDKQQEESLFHLDNSDLSAITTTGAEEHIVDIHRQDSIITVEGNDDRLGSSILFQEETRSSLYSSGVNPNNEQLENESTRINEDVLISLSNLDISKIVTDTTTRISKQPNNVPSNQDQSVLCQSNILGSPVKLLSSNANSSSSSSKVTISSTPKINDDRSQLHFSIASQPTSQRNYNKNESINEEHILTESMGTELAKVICRKDNKKTIPLLSIICNLMERSKAEIIIGRTIGTREWTKARKHAIFPGAGEPFEMNFWKNHRKRISNEQLIQFMEWLKAAGLIQNLSFGHKIVQYHNGLHVSIESVKRTESLRNIVNKYYSDFLDVVQEIEELEEDKNECFYDEEASIDSERSDYDDEQENRNIDPCPNGEYNSYTYLELYSYSTFYHSFSCLLLNECSNYSC